VSPAGLVATLACGEQGFSRGTGVTAQFNFPNGVSVAPEGRAYVADCGFQIYNVAFQRFMGCGIPNVFNVNATSGRCH
jgi:hypothetical protein